jgi:hypothetical protein
MCVRADSKGLYVLDLSFHRVVFGLCAWLRVLIQYYWYTHGWGCSMFVTVDVESVVQEGTFFFFHLLN